MDFQRGAGRFYLNPTLAGHPARDRSLLLAAMDNGPLQVTLAPQESVAFIPADQVPRAQHILQGEQGFRLDTAGVKGFSPPAGVWPLLSRPSPIDELRKAPA